MSPKTIGYGSIENSNVEANEEQPLVQNEKSLEAVSNSKTRKWIVVGLLVIVVATFCVLSNLNHGDDTADEVIQTTSILGAPQELGLRGVERADDASPSSIWGKKRKGPLPTNSWYQNLVSHRADTHADDSSRAYTTPYIIDTAAAGKLVGIRVHWPVSKADAKNIQMVNDVKAGLTLGTSSSNVERRYEVDSEEDLSPLGVTLRWMGGKDGNIAKDDILIATDDDADKNEVLTPVDDDIEIEGLNDVTTTTNITNDGIDFMKSHIVRGMPYATMQYYGSVLPSLYSENAPASDIQIDNSTTISCGTLSEDGTIAHNSTASVQKELKMHFLNTDFTWLVFFSHPVKIECGVGEGDIKLANFRLNVLKSQEEKKDDKGGPLTVRIALVDQCTTGKAEIAQHCDEKKLLPIKDMDKYLALLRSAASMVPTTPKLSITYSETDDGENKNESSIQFDWVVKDFPNKVFSGRNETNALGSSNNNFVMFALPHHQNQLMTSSDDIVVTNFCVNTFHGKTCLIQSSGKWTMRQPMMKARMNAKRPPAAKLIPFLARSVKKDLKYRLSDNLHRGAADTYFSGKILARQARTLLLADELLQLASGDDAALEYDQTEDLHESITAAKKEVAFSRSMVEKATKDLQTCVQVWFNRYQHGKADYVYDSSWGGLVNCGCSYTTKDEYGHCNNTYPNCPALSDVNVDFGNGYYNDHHFHYGYHVYAAAIVAKQDPAWGRAHFKQMLLYIRDYANPFSGDNFFPPFRQKDWWLGSSWASGIVSAENSPHGRNQESSSEAIAAYESMAVFGKVMKGIFADNNEDLAGYEIAELVEDAGTLLMTTEVEAAHRYWHVWSSPTHFNSYPSTYNKLVVGMLYETAASFQTWFAPYPLVSYGIQLLPLTPIAEERDNPDWARLLYPVYQQSCKDAPDDFCVENGWSIVQTGLCATASGKDCLEQALSIPPAVYETDGGMGNSLSNTIWFIATRPTDSGSITETLPSSNSTTSNGSDY